MHLPLGGESTHVLLRRVVRLFDLDADGDSIHRHLLKHKGLAPWLKQAPGLRVPGAWDGFETAVRAVLGQQVSVARGTDLANALIQRYGQGEFRRHNNCVMPISLRSVCPVGVVAQSAPLRNG